MLNENDIRNSVSSITSRPISEEAVNYLLKGSNQYAEECLARLGYQPTKQEAANLVRQVISRIPTSGEMITLKELQSICKQLPFPFNLWFC